MVLNILCSLVSTRRRSPTCKLDPPLTNNGDADAGCCKASLEAPLLWMFHSGGLLLSSSLSFSSYAPSLIPLISLFYIPGLLYFADPSLSWLTITLGTVIGAFVVDYLGPKNTMVMSLQVMFA